MSDFYSSIEQLSHVSGVPIYLLNGGTVTASFPLDCCGPSDYMLSLVGSGSPAISSLPDGYLICSIALDNIENVDMLLVGPVESIDCTGNIFSLFERLTDIPVCPQMTSSKLADAASLAYFLITGQSVEPIALIEGDVSEEDEFEEFEETEDYGGISDIDDIDMNDVEENIISQRIYTGGDAEKQIISYIFTGGASELGDEIHLPDSIDSAMLLKNDNPKISIFILSALSAIRSARNAGLQPADTFTIPLEWLAAAGSTDDSDMIDKCFQQMIYELSQKVKDSGLDKLPKPVRTVHDYIVQRLYSPIDMKKLFSASGVKHNTLLRLFKESLNMPPLPYMRILKVREAEFLLKFTDMSLLEVSETLHFTAQSHFTEIFKRLTGTTPGSYRKEMSTLRSPDELLSKIKTDVK